MASGDDAPHLPRAAPIEAYGNGGFRFDEMSHRGSLLCLPDGVWAWPVERADRIDEASLARVFARTRELDTLIVGTGRYKSLEETAAAILRLYSERQASPGKDPQGASLL